MANLKFTDVSKIFEKAEVLKSVNLEVQDGEFVVLVGPSGCGKSTMLRIMAGLETVTSGQVTIGEKDVTDLPPGDRHIAMVFQSYALYPHMTVAKNLSFGLENERMPKQEIQSRVDEAARMLAIENLLQRRPKELSGGQRQRVAIGRAIVRHPDIFLFDEPLSNLDAALRVQTRSEISRLHKRLGATMIYVTHDQVEAMTMADRIAVLNGGQIEQFGTPMELFDHPRNLFVAGFIGSPKMNFFDATVLAATDSSVTLQAPGFKDLTLPVCGTEVNAGDTVTLGLRPNHITLSNGNGLASFTAEYSESVGTETYVYGSVGAANGNGNSAILHLPGYVAIEEGQILSLDIDLPLFHVFRSDNGLALSKRKTDGTLIAAPAA